MFSNKVWGLDYSPRKLLAMCCGFFTTSGREESEGRFDDGGKAVKTGLKDDHKADSVENQKVKSAGSVTYGTTDNAPANG